MAPEMVEVVSTNDDVLYTTTLDDCKSRGLLHRTVCGFLRNSKDEILLQLRSFSDDWLPGKWTVSCSGHVRAGEPIEQACVRELREELGIESSPRFLFKMLLPRITWSRFTEYEFAHVFECSSDSTPKVNAQEVEKVKFVTPAELSHLLEIPSEEFTGDAIILLKRYLHKAER